MIWVCLMIGRSPMKSPVKYCAIALTNVLPYMSVFSLNGFRLSFNEFEVRFMNHLRIYLSQLHSVSWAYMKVFLYWCECKNDVPTLKLFFTLFNVERTSTTTGREQRRLSFFQSKKMFDVYI